MVGLFGRVGSRGVQDHVSLSECAYLTCLPLPAFSEVAVMERPWKRKRCVVWLCTLGTLFSSVFQVAVVLVRSMCQSGVLPVVCSLLHVPSGSMSVNATCEARGLRVASYKSPSMSGPMMVSVSRAEPAFSPSCVLQSHDCTGCGISILRELLFVLLPKTSSNAPDGALCKQIGTKLCPMAWVPLQTCPLHMW